MLIFAIFAIYVRAYIYKPPLTRGRPFLAIVGWPGLRVPRQWVGDRLMCVPYRAQKCVRGAHIRRVDLAVLGPRRFRMHQPELCSRSKSWGIYCAVPLGGTIR